jgi:hypothetical protein
MIAIGPCIGGAAGGVPTPRSVAAGTTGWGLAASGGLWDCVGSTAPPIGGVCACILAGGLALGLGLEALTLLAAGCGAGLGLATGSSSIGTGLGVGKAGGFTT